MTDQAEKSNKLAITDGPAKPDLQWSIEHKIGVTFDAGHASLKVRVDRMDELGDGTRFALRGEVLSANYMGRQFFAVYDLGSRSGSIDIDR